jgi:hypothetical protein
VKGENLSRERSCPMINVEVVFGLLGATPGVTPARHGEADNMGGLKIL